MVVNPSAWAIILWAGNKTHFSTSLINFTVICAGAPVLASVINFKDLFCQISINFVDINALARLLGQSFLNFVDIYALTRF